MKKARPEGNGQLVPRPGAFARLFCAGCALSDRPDGA